jgi:hypothetical protein
MNKIENIASKIKTKLEENEKKEKSLQESLPENSRSINMKQFWSNINSIGFKKSSKDNIILSDPFLVRHFIELYSQPDIDRDILFSKSGFPRNFSAFLNKYLEKYTKKNNMELIDKICGFNLCLEKNKYNFKTNTNDINSEIITLEKILLDLEDINYNNGIKIQEYSNKQEKINLENKKSKGLYTPSSILTKENIYENLINQIYNLQMKQFAECICGVHRINYNGKWKYKVIFEINDFNPSLEMDEEYYKNLIKYRDPLNSISVYDLFQEKTHSYYNTDKISSKYNKLNIEEVIEKGIELEKDSKNSKIELRTIKHHSNYNKQNKKKHSKTKKSKKIKKITKENGNFEENELLGNLPDYQIGKRTNIDYYYCHHCKQRKPAEFSIQCKSSFTENKYCQRPFKSFVVNGATIIRSK